jgi:peptidoglycan/LPS O-acetylase OafA/YrhL
MSTPAPDWTDQGPDRRLPAEPVGAGTPEPSRSSALTPRQLADLVSFVLVSLGLCLMVVAAYRWDTTVGIAATGAALVAVGVAVGVDRSR